MLLTGNYSSNLQRPMAYVSHFYNFLLLLLLLTFILVPLLARIPYINRITPESTSFLSDYESGFHSSTFDLSGNLSDSETRTGLDPAAKREIDEIRGQHPSMGFDEARAMYLKRKMERNGVGEDGLPRDPKLVVFGGR